MEKVDSGGYNITQIIKGGGKEKTLEVVNKKVRRERGIEVRRGGY
jgi:hypothetical protein